MFCSASKTSLESLGNITMTSRKSTKPSINDFQDFVSMMQKTITGLRKQVVFFSYSFLSKQFSNLIYLLQDNVFVKMMKYIPCFCLQIKRLENRLSKTECTDNNGQERKDGERWKKDSCTLCECKVGFLAKSLCTLLNPLYSIP